MINKFYNNKVIVFVIFFFVCLLSGHAFETIFPIQIPVIVLLSIIMIPALMAKVLLGKIDILMIWYLLFVCSIAFTTVVHYYSLNSYIIQLIYITTGLAIVYVYDFTKIVRFFLNVMTVVTAISLIGYFLVNYMNINNILPRVENINDVEYAIGGIFNYITFIPQRNCGMFWEPGLFATFLLWAIVFELLYMDFKVNWSRIFLFLCGILTANSTAGFVLVCVCIVMYIVKNKKSKNINIIIQIFGIVIFAIVFIIVINLDTIILNTSLKDNEFIIKLLPEAFFNSSRVNAIIHNLQIFSDNPIFGAGIRYVYENTKYVADTSTSTNLMAIYGLGGSLFTMAFIYGIAKLKNINFYTKVCLLFLVLSIINKEPHQQNLFTWIMLFSFIKQSSKHTIRSFDEKNKKIMG